MHFKLYSSKWKAYLFFLAFALTDVNLFFFGGVGLKSMVIPEQDALLDTW